jgi:hypothetical protein
VTGRDGMDRRDDVGQLGHDDERDQMTEAQALPAEALPTEALPAEALPAEALPTERLPSGEHDV